MKTQTLNKLKQLVAQYHTVMDVMEHDAKKSIREDSRAYGGFVRAAKGKIQEFLTEELVRVAWCIELGRASQRLEINSNKIKIPIKKTYIDNIQDKRVKNYIEKNIESFVHGLSVDKHVFVDKKFVMGIECKAYAENAMLKRILVDFMLLKTKYPNLRCYLFQLESQLGGDYSDASKNPLGSKPTHSIMSYFDDVRLNIVTLLSGERKVDRPINKKEYFKPLKEEQLAMAVDILCEGFEATEEK